jgi:hypothetical protein
VPLLPTSNYLNLDNIQIKHVIQFHFQKLFLTGGTDSIPYAAPSTGAFARVLPVRGAAGSRALPECQGRPFRQPPVKARNGGNKRHPGRLSFGYFSLAEQRKVSRPRGRDSDSNSRRGSDTTAMTVFRSCGGLPSGIHPTNHPPCSVQRLKKR